jgi:hypothetical protein
MVELSPGRGPQQMSVVVGVGMIALFVALAPHANAQSPETSNLGALQTAVRQMCVQPDQKGHYLRYEGDLQAGATLRVLGVNGEGTVTKEQWDGINQRLDQYKTDPRECAIQVLGILIPSFYPPPPPDYAGRDITGYRREFDVTRLSAEMRGGHNQGEWCDNLSAILRGEQPPGTQITFVRSGETQRNTCAPANCPAYTYSCTLHVKADPLCR